MQNLSRRRFLKIGAAASLALLNPHLSLSSWFDNMAILDLPSVHQQLVDSIARFGIICEPSEDIPLEESLYCYYSLNWALETYQKVSITDFSNKFSGALHFLINRDGHTLEGKTPYYTNMATAFHWTGDINQLVYILPATGNDRRAWLPDHPIQRQSISRFANGVAYIYSLHELYHALQFRDVPPNQSNVQVYTSSGMQDLMWAMGITIMNPPSEVQQKASWELTYAFADGGDWINRLSRYDFRLGGIHDPIIESAAVAMSQHLWDSHDFKTQFKPLDEWAIREIARLHD